MDFCIGPATILGTISTVALGVATPEKIETYVGVNYSPWDNEQITLTEPIGSFGVQYDINKSIRLFAEHISSPRQCNDHPGINHAGVKFLAPLGYDTTLYSGLSLNNPGFDNDDSNDFKGPLVSFGVEHGGNVKVFAEYLTSTGNFDGGRVGAGIKLIFK